MFQSEQVNEIAGALASAQSEMDFARKDSANPFFKSSYADLASVWEVCRQVLPKNGLAVSQVLEPCEGQSIRVRTTLLHKSGQWVSGVCQLPMVKPDPQAAGSAITYARRYSLAAIVGVIADDDDAEGAMDRGEKRPKKTAPKPPASAPTIDLTAMSRDLAAITTVTKLNAYVAANKDEWVKASNVEAARELFRKREAEILTDQDTPKDLILCNRDGEPVSVSRVCAKCTDKGNCPEFRAAKDAA